MLALYLAALGFGSSLILMSLFLGGGDKDFDKDADLDQDLELEADVEAEADADVEADGQVEGKEIDVASDAMWIPFLSMRFWTFGMAAFGLAGTLLTLLSVPWLLAAFVAIAVGMGIGTGAAWLFKQLKKDEVSAETRLDRYAGEEARVLLPIRPGGRGKIVVETLAGRVEMLASSRDSKPIERGATVIIAHVRDGVADVSALAGVRSDAERRRELADASRQQVSRDRPGV